MAAPTTMSCMKCAPIITLPMATSVAIVSIMYRVFGYLWLSTAAAMNAVAACPDGKEYPRYSVAVSGLGACIILLSANIIVEFIIVAVISILFVIFSPSTSSMVR